MIERYLSLGGTTVFGATYGVTDAMFTLEKCNHALYVLDRLERGIRVLQV